MFQLLNFADKRVEPIPALFQDVIERLVPSQVVNVKPDACIVDFYNEVHSFSHFWVLFFMKFLCEIC